MKRGYFTVTLFVLIGCGGEPFSTDFSSLLEDGGLDVNNNIFDVISKDIKNESFKDVEVDKKDSNVEPIIDAGIDSNSFDATTDTTTDTTTDVVEDVLTTDVTEDVLTTDVAEDVYNDVVFEDSNQVDSNLDSNFADINDSEINVFDSGLDVFEDVEASCSFDLQTDSMNCGFCGHSCENGDCVSGICLPVVIDNKQSPGGIIVYDEYVYWVYSGGLERQYAFSGPSEHLSSGNASLGTLTLYNGALYYSSKYMSDIRKYTVYSNSSEIIFNNTNYVFSLAANSSFIYGIKYDTEFSGENSVFRGSISSKQIENFVSPISPRHLAVDNNYIYFGDLYYKVIFRQSITGSSDPVFLSEDNHPRQITVDNSFVYWANGSSPTGIYKVSKNGGIKEKLTDAINAWGIYLYNDYLYWTDSDGGTINRISKNGGTNEVLAENQSSPRNITVDSHAVYWSNSGNNTVMKLVF